MSDTRQKKYGEAPAPRGPRPAGRATERRSFHEESRNDRERGRRSEAPRRQYSSFTGEQAERPSRRQEEFSGWSRPGQREARAPRDARPSPWQMESELLPALPDVVQRELDALGQALRTVRPLRSAHYRNLPADIEALSRLLTCERSGLYRPYWSSPASTSAYLYYFLPWNVLRLARLFRSLPLPDPRLWLEKGQTPLLLDGGSGPLSVPLALWLARPEWRALPIQVLAADNAVQPMELGRDVMAAWGDILGQPVWQVRVERGSLEHMPRLKRKLADTLERQERHLRPWLLTAANVLNELSAESRQMNREDDEDEEGSGGVRRLENLLDELEPLCWPAPLNEDETGSADEALLPAALFVEPGTRLGGKTISRLRDAALERDLMPLAPCTHRAPCPLAHAHAGRGWCHFTFDCEGAPQWLQELSSAAGLAKSALSLAPLLLRADPAAGESLFDDLDDLDDDALDNSREAAAMLRQPRPVRVLSSPFVVPGLRGQARYACCAAGLAVVPDAAALPSGAQLTARAQADERPGTPRRDRKSGALLLALPTGFEGALIYQGADRCAARVLSTDDSAILDTGLVRSGEQVCTLELLGGKFRGRTVQGHNLLNGSLEQDKIFAPGDRALVVISYRGDEILTVTMTDHYRLDKESALAAAFALLLILFAGKTGLRAIASFMLTILMLWKVLIPLYLKGYNPILVGLAVTLVLTVLILSLVYGFDRRAAAAERVGLRVNFHVDNRRKCGKISAISKKPR